MGEFAPIQQTLGGGVLPIRAHTEAIAPVLAPVESTSGGRGPQARMDTATPPLARPSTRERGESDTAARMPERPKIDEFTLIGPSPAFQANVLELERDLQRAIERLEAERSRVEAEAAIKIERAEARADAAETARDTAESKARKPEKPVAPVQATPAVPEAPEPPKEAVAATEAPPPEPVEATEA
ncbi:hypothetical protein [Pseudoruegeria sp. HB172150]|uniref:hypothetical protein n=1 Tax=Pseudoruegeria sp. HB172150 TaxID=2721164 RepID=UPI0015573CF5|nr:hypothetical protein [Pseudoruegeria sp. HB172150]